MDTINKQQEIKKALAQLNNIAYISDILFKPLTEIKDEDIERKQKAYDYLKKYASLTIKQSTQTLKELIENNT